MNEQPTDEELDLLPGGDFIAPDVSPEAREFISRCRQLIYSEEFTPIVKQALTGAGSLAESIAPVLMEVISRAQDKIGPLSDEDMQAVAAHLAGTLVSTAKILGDPEAENAQEAVEDILGLMDELAAGGEVPPEEMEAPEPQEQAPARALGQLA